MAKATMKVHTVKKTVTFKRKNTTAHCPVCGKFYSSNKKKS